MIASIILKIFSSTKKLFSRLCALIYIKVHTVIIYISLALYNSENEILRSDPNDLDENKKTTQRMVYKNPFIEMVLSGIRDEKIINDYYETLRQADKFIRTATPHQMAVAADKYGTSYGMKDPYGRRYEHYGFFDDKHKHAGKTIGEVIALEFEERRTKDDELEIMYIFNNKPIEVGLAKVMDVVERKADTDEYVVLDIEKKSKQFQFPINVIRENKDAVNKIEELTEFLHIKKIGFEYRQLEFFVPLKFKTNKLDDESEIFKEIIDIKEAFIRDEYGQLIGFGIIKFMKRINYNDTHEVLKFEGIEMKQMGVN